ncbi:MAG: permease [Desulfovermiculus sp.]|nr:permease [Desulfovermiculus sp.]
MLFAFFILGSMAVILLFIAWRRGDGSLGAGVRQGWEMGINLIPLLIAAFALAGLIQVAIPAELIQVWLGEGSGLRGIVIGTVAGALIAGGPYVSFPIIASVYQAGAGVGTTVALITGWAMLGLGQIPFELSLVGPRFTLIRLCTVCITPILAGILAQIVFGSGFTWP